MQTDEMRCTVMSSLNLNRKGWTVLDTFVIENDRSRESNSNRLERILKRQNSLFSFFGEQKAPFVFGKKRRSGTFSLYYAYDSIRQRYSTNCYDQVFALAVPDDNKITFHIIDRTRRYIKFMLILFFAVFVPLNILLANFTYSTFADNGQFSTKGCIIGIVVFLTASLLELLICTAKDFKKADIPEFATKFREMIISRFS